MRLSIVCLSLAFVASRVLANELSGPYQASFSQQPSLFLWYAYRLDIAAGGTFIAPDCPGTGEGKRCYFDEFLRYIENVDDGRLPWSGSTSVGKNLAPNVFSTAEELVTAEYSNLVDPDVIYKTPPGYKNFRGLFEPAIDNIQKCRQALGDKGIDWELNGIRTSISNTLDARLADNAPYIVDGVNEKLAETGFSWTAETKPVKGLDGNTWHEVDVEATIAAHPDDAFEGLDDAINDYILHFDQQPSESNKNKRHMRAIWASESFASRVLGDPSC